MPTVRRLGRQPRRDPSAQRRNHWICRLPTAQPSPPQQRSDPSVAVARVLFGEFPHLPFQFLLPGRRQSAPIPIGSSGQPKEPAHGSPRAHPCLDHEEKIRIAARQWRGSHHRLPADSLFTWLGKTKSRHVVEHHHAVLCGRSPQGSVRPHMRNARATGRVAALIPCSPATGNECHMASNHCHTRRRFEGNSEPVDHARPTSREAVLQKIVRGICVHPTKYLRCPCPKTPRRHRRSSSAT